MVEERVEPVPDETCRCGASGIEAELELRGAGLFGGSRRGLFGAESADREDVGHAHATRSARGRVRRSGAANPTEIDAQMFAHAPALGARQRRGLPSRADEPWLELEPEVGPTRDSGDEENGH